MTFWAIGHCRISGIDNAVLESLSVASAEFSKTVKPSLTAAVFKDVCKIRQFAALQPQRLDLAHRQKGSDPSSLGARHRRNGLRRFSVSATEKPQMTKRYRTV